MGSTTTSGFYQPDYPTEKHWGALVNAGFLSHEQYKSHINVSGIMKEFHCDPDNPNADDNSPTAGRLDTPFETLHALLLAIGVNASTGNITGFNGKIKLWGALIGATPTIFTTGFTKRVKFVGGSFIIECTGYNSIGGSGNEDGGSALIEATVDNDAVFDFEGTWMIYVRGLAVRNNGTNGDGIKRGGAAVGGMVFYQCGAEACTNRGFIATGDGVDGLQDRGCTTKGCGTGFWYGDDGVHAPNRASNIDCRAEDSVHVGIRVGTTLATSGTSTGGHVVVIDNFGCQGLTSPPDTAGILIEGTAGVYIRGEYPEQGFNADVPFLKVTCRTGGSVSEQNDWASDIIWESYFANGFPSAATLSGWTSASKTAFFADVDACFRFQMRAGHSKGGSSSTYLTALGSDPDNDGMPNFPAVRLRVNTYACSVDIVNLRPADTQHDANKPALRDLIVQDDNGWLYNVGFWYDPINHVVKRVGPPERGVGIWIYDLPTTPTVALGASQGGTVTVGLHSYKVIYVYEGGKTRPSAASSQINVTSSAHIVNVTIPTSSDGRVAARYIYRTISGDTGAYKLAGTVMDNSTTTFADSTPDGSLGSSVSNNGVIDALSNEIVRIIISDSNAFTIPNPSNAIAGQKLSFDIKNASGGSHGAITWDSAFSLDGALAAIANGKRKTINFYDDGTNWVQLGSETADI